MSRKWQIEKSFFDKEIMGYDTKTKKDVTWPYYDSEEESYKEWLKQVQDPITKEFYKGKDVKVDYDNAGKEIPSTKQIIEKEPYFVRRQIVRIRTRDKKEFLYSRGHMYGYTTYGEVLAKKFQEPEIWEQQSFKHHMEYIAKDNKHKNVCDGPTAGSTIHHTLEFNIENIDELMKNAIPDVALMVKEEGGRVKQCPDLEMFKTKSFDYIINMDYLTEKQKQDKLDEFKASQEGSKKK